MHSIHVKLCKTSKQNYEKYLKPKISSENLI